MTGWWKKRGSLWKGLLCVVRNRGHPVVFDERERVATCTDCGSEWINV